MAGKGAVRFDKRTGISRAEADENQRRWSDARYRSHCNEKNVHFYDVTRRGLNFEISKGGVIAPCATSKPISDRLQERLAELNFRNKGGKQNSVVEFILSGDVETLRKLAFGDQKVDYTRDPDSVDNSSVVRQKGIEQWALDCYNWVAKTYGEENIVGCDVHLDENSPHMHISFVPTAIDRLTGQEKVSVAAHFGKPSQISALHDNYYANVGRKYGLERGDSVEGRDVRHLTTREYVIEKQNLEKQIETLRHTIADLETQKADVYEKVQEGILTVEEKEERIAQIDSQIEDAERQLSNLISAGDAVRERTGELEREEEETKQRVEELKKTEKQLNTKIKGLRTMIANLEKERDGLRTQISALEADIALGRISREDGQKKLDDLLKRTAECEAKLQDKTEKLEAAVHELDAFLEEKDSTKNEVADISSAKEAMVQETNKVIGDLRNSAIMRCSQAAWNEGRNFFMNEIYPHLNPQLQEAADKSVFGLMSQEGSIELSANLFLGVAPFSVGSGPAGGGTSHSDIPWGKRKDDEDDLSYAHRCNVIAGKVIRSRSRGRRR